jgi:flagellar protein FliS
LVLNPYLKQLRRAEVDAADPPATLLLLVNEAVRLAENATSEGDASARRRMVDRSRRIVLELANTLNVDYGGEMAFNLLRLYLFINRRLVDFAGGEEKGLEDALRILRHVRDTWEGAVSMARRERGA